MLISSKKAIKLFNMMYALKQFKFSDIKNTGLRESLRNVEVFIEYMVPNKTIATILNNDLLDTLDYSHIKFIYGQITNYKELDKIVTGDKNA